MIILDKINPEEVILQVSKFIIDKVANKQGCVLGLSGGIDSAVVAFIVKNAFKNTDFKLRLYGLPENKDSKLIADFLNLNIENINIDELNTKLNIKFDSKIQQGNAKSTLRSLVLANEALKHDSLILGTGNRDEFYLGYFTKRGDGQVDLQPLLSLTKRMVFELAKFLNIPGKIIQKAPSAGLWDGQTDENELGFTYDEAELIINGFLQGFSKEEINQITKIDLNKIEKVKHLHEKTQHKRQLPCFPNVIKRPNGINTCNKALVIGRFQMVHFGHVDLFNQIKEHKNIKKIIVGIGTGNINTIKYLFNFDEVKRFLKPVLEELNLEFELIEVPDINDTIKYADYVKSLIPDLDDKTVVVSGEALTIKCFQHLYPILIPEKRIVIDSSRIRKLIINNKPFWHLLHHSCKCLDYEKKIKEFLL